MYLEITDLDQFIEELQSRDIQEVRENRWVRIQKIHETRKARFTAWDPREGVILRLDATYYQDIFHPEDEEKQKEIEGALAKIVNPVREKIEKVARIKNGEYHTGRAEW